MSLLPHLPHKQGEPVQKERGEEPQDNPANLEEPDSGRGDK